jgi:hypothetical protein
MATNNYLESWHKIHIDEHTWTNDDYDVINGDECDSVDVNTIIDDARYNKIIKLKSMPYTITYIYNLII